MSQITKSQCDQCKQLSHLSDDRIEMKFHLSAHTGSQAKILYFEFCSVKCAGEWIAKSGSRYTMTQESVKQFNPQPTEGE